MARLLFVAFFLLAIFRSNIAISANPFAKAVADFTQQHCVSCHDGRKEKGDFRIDTLSRDLSDPAIAIAWQDAIDLVEAGEMPPEKQPRPSAGELKRFLSAIKAELRRVAKSSEAKHEMSFRRLSHSAMDNTVRDLLGTRLKLSDGLPADAEVAGFDNMTSTLGQSSEMMSVLQSNARRIAADVIDDGADPRVEIDLDMNQMTPGSRVERIGNELVFWSSKNRANTAWPKDFVAPRTGVYRISMDAFQLDNRHQLMRAGADIKSIGSKKKLQALSSSLPEDASRQIAVMALQAPIQLTLGESAGGRRAGTVNVSDSLSTVTVDCELTAGESFFIYAIDCPRSQNAARAEINGESEVILGEQMHLRRVQVKGPLLPSWPPSLPSQLLGSNALLSRPGLKSFLARAFRQPAQPDVLELYEKLFSESRNQDHSAHESLRHLIEAVLCSPRFLYSRTPESSNDAWALASRLSYFLWNSMPDDELIQLAASGDILKSDVIESQVRRMIADDKANDFVVDFTGQWLGLRKVGAMLPDPKLYPDYDNVLKESMRAETEALFREILRNNLPVTDFLSPRFAMLNERLARHYGIKDVIGNEIRRVPLPAGSPRGGLLGHASMLTITSDGTRTSPVVRGVWVLENLLNSPPAPPPPDVKPIEPDVRGATSIREMLAKHRDVATCNECHRRIDPWGFGLENFDAIGAWRDNYGTGQTGKLVDATGTTPSGYAFDGAIEMRDQILAQSDRVAHALTAKLLSHAVGHPTTIKERIEIDSIVHQQKASGIRFADLIVSICQSDSFAGR